MQPPSSSPDPVGRAAKLSGEIAADLAEYLCVSRHNPPPGLVCHQCLTVLEALFEVVWEDVMVCAATDQLLREPVDPDLGWNPQELVRISEDVLRALHCRVEQLRAAQQLISAA